MQTGAERIQDDIDNHGDYLIRLSHVTKLGWLPCNVKGARFNRDAPNAWARRKYTPLDVCGEWPQYTTERAVKRYFGVLPDELSPKRPQSKNQFKKRLTRGNISGKVQA